jgi:hydroxymethylpyrimidine/phosphomethylpyrimidine kinase
VTQKLIYPVDFNTASVNWLQLASRMMPNRPNVLAFSGHDPSGGAGIQADIEAIASHQCHAVNVITALTEQNTQGIVKLIPQNPENIARQAATLAADLAINAIKIGLLGHPSLIQPIQVVLKQFPAVPVILDPVLASGDGTDLASDDLVGLINDLLLPYTTVLTPNSLEARRLAGRQDLNACGLYLLDKGCDYVLITGTHENSPAVHNLLFHNGQCLETYSLTRLPHSYHGSGCTLAASIAALLAQGLDMMEAVAEAQEYTWNTLANAYQPGKGQFVPNRLYWVDDE